MNPFAPPSSSAPPMAPEVSLIVNTYQKPRHLALVLESIALQTGIDAAMELVVADDGSEDETADLVERFAARVPFPVRFTTEPHDGFRLARVRNRGAAIARGATLLFLDGDSILPPDHVAAHLARRRPGWAQLGDVARLSEASCRDLEPATLWQVDIRRLVPADERRRLARRHRKAGLQNLLHHPSKPRLAGGNFAIWRDDYLRINGSDERFRGWGQEDDDLGLRLRAAGVRLASILDRTNTYHVWHPTDPSATPRWRDGVNVAYFLRRGRLTRCRSGLETRFPDSILWGLPADLAATGLGRELDRLLAAAPRAPTGAPCEIEIVVEPGSGRFTRRSECRWRLVEDEPAADRLPAEQRLDPQASAMPPGLWPAIGWARRADRTDRVSAGSGALAELLQRIG